jgi:hypothetical protein
MKSTWKSSKLMSSERCRQSGEKYTHLCVEGIHIHSSKSKHSNVITQHSNTENWESTQSLSFLSR